MIFYKKEKDTFVFYSWSYIKGIWRWYLSHIDLMFCLCFFESKSMVSSLLSRSKSLCAVFTFFCCCSKYIYILRETMMQLISDQHEGQPQSKVLFIGQQVDFPFLPPHTPFHMVFAALWPIIARPVLSAIQNERRLKFMLVFSCCSSSSSGNICIVAVKLLKSC